VVTTLKKMIALINVCVVLAHTLLTQLQNFNLDKVKDLALILLNLPLLPIII